MVLIYIELKVRVFVQPLQPRDDGLVQAGADVLNVILDTTTDNRKGSNRAANVDETACSTCRKSGSVKCRSRNARRSETYLIEDGSPDDSLGYQCPRIGVFLGASSQDPGSWCQMSSGDRGPHILLCNI